MQSAITAAKFSDWGIYNYKAVVAYDGTAYKWASFFHRKIGVAMTMKLLK